jgi:hypothetical protein
MSPSASQSRDVNSNCSASGGRRDIGYTRSDAAPTRPREARPVRRLRRSYVPLRVGLRDWFRQMGYVCLSEIKLAHTDDGVRQEMASAKCDHRHVLFAATARPCRLKGECACHCTTRFENAHRTVLCEVLYRHHPWFGRRVCIHGAVDRDGFVVFRCTLEESRADRALEVPAWMFDRTACCPCRKPNPAGK